MACKSVTSHSLHINDKSINCLYPFRKEHTVGDSSDRIFILNNVDFMQRLCFLHGEELRAIK
jgi:hypothetical protein